MGNDNTLKLLKEVGQKYEKKVKEISPFSPIGMLDFEEFTNDTPDKIYNDEVYGLTGYNGYGRNEEW